MGGVGHTANPTAVSDGQRIASMMDKVGRNVVVQGQVRQLVTTQYTAIASTVTETTIVTAGGAGVFNDLSSLVITNATATAVSCTLKDSTAGTTRGVFDLAANGGIVINFHVPMNQATAANNWTITLSVATVTVHITAIALQNT
jgi:hypothetical protein